MQSFFGVYMLPKKYRLKSTAAFNATYKNHNIISDDNVCIYLGREKKDASFDTRIAFIAGKKIHKRAVVRNRIKRLMRESIRLALKNNELNALHKYLSVLCIAKSGSIGASFADIDASMHRLLGGLSQHYIYFE